jgi:hypothetical protein
VTTAAVHRPVGVAIVAILGFVQAIFSFLTGIALIVERNNSALHEHIDNSSGAITSYGVGAIIWGVIAFFVALGLWNGAGWARIVVAILQAIAIGGGVYLLFAWGGTYIWSGLWQILIALIVLYFLYGARSEDFFASRQR